MEDRALFVRDGDAFVGTVLTQGGWDPKSANGGTALALVGHCLDDVPTLVPMVVARLSADLVRPVPIGTRLEVVPTILREGKKIQVVLMQVMVDGVEHVRATALRLRIEDLSGHPELPPSSIADRPADALLPPDEAVSYRATSTSHPGFLRAVDMRRAAKRDGSGTGVWIRLDADVVAGEEVRATARLALAIDFANLIGVDVRPTTITMINPDVSAQVLRPPLEGWIGVTGDTRFDHRTGHGVSSAQLSDDAGVFALATTSQLLQPR